MLRRSLSRFMALSLKGTNGKNVLIVVVVVVVVVVVIVVPFDDKSDMNTLKND